MLSLSKRSSQLMQTRQRKSNQLQISSSSFSSKTRDSPAKWGAKLSIMRWAGQTQNSLILIK